MPQRHAEAQALLAFEIDVAAINRDFENALERGFRGALRIQQAYSAFFDREFVQPSAFQLDHYREFFRSTNGDTFSSKPYRSSRK